MKTWYCMPNLKDAGLAYREARSAPYESLEDLLITMTGCDHECHQMATRLYDLCDRMSPDSSGIIRLFYYGLIIDLYDSQKDEDTIIGE